MPASSQITVKALGLNINPNYLDLANGSLIVANDVIIRRENVIESRRGLSDWSASIGLSNNTISQLIEYKGRVLANWDTTLSFDTGVLDTNNQEIFSDFAGSFSSASAYKMRFIEANKNLYLTTNDGIKKISAASASDFSTAAGYIQDAGAVKSIDFTATLDITQGQLAGFLPEDSTAAYRTVWGYKDANNNLILGTPSSRVTVYNYLANSLVMDLNKLLTILDIYGDLGTASAANTLIKDTNFYNLFSLSINPIIQEMKTNVIDLAQKIDENLLFANTSTGAPFLIDHILMDASGTVTLDFTLPTISISSVSVANPTVITTSTPHGLPIGSPVNVIIAGTSTTPSINGPQTATATGTNTFTLPINVTAVAIGTGTFTSSVANYISSSDYITLAGLTAPVAQSIASWTPGTTTTFTTTLPNIFNVGDTVIISGVAAIATDASITGPQIVTAISTNSFTINVKTTAVLNGTGSAIYPDLSFLNNNYLVTGVNASSLTFIYSPVNTSLTLAAIPTTPVNLGTTVNSYNFTNITISGDTAFPVSLNDTGISVPATAGQTATIQDTISRIVTQLRSVLPSVISTTLNNEYLAAGQYNLTLNGNVNLKVTIPSSIVSNPNYFLQLYRSNVFSAFNESQTDTLILGTTVIADDELHLVYEVTPNSTDLANGYITYLDQYPDLLAQTNTPLYTNPSTGDGILQSNDQPPFAADINTFKNVTFYANTKTRHIIPNFQLLGVDNISNGDQITIGNDLTSNTYTFINGAQQATTYNITAANPAALKTAIQNNYFTIDNVNDTIKYYVWYRYDAVGTDPLVPNKTGVVIDVLSTDTVALVCQRTSETLNDIIFDFTSTFGTQYAFSSITPGTTTSFTTSTNNNFITGDIVTITGVTQTGGTTITGTQTVTVTGSNTFTISTPSTPTGVIFLSASNVSIVKSFQVVNADQGIVSNAPTIGNISSSNLAVHVDVVGTGENAALGEVLISRTVSAAINIDLTARSLIRVINYEGNNSPVYAYYTSADNTSPGQIDLEAKTLQDNPFYIIASGPLYKSNMNGIGNSFTPDISPTHITTGAITTSITSGYVTFNATAHGLQNTNEVIITNTDSTPPVNGVFTIANVTTNTFDVLYSALSSPGTHFSWELTSDSVASTNDTNPNRVYYSKYGQPEAVPILNFFDIGPEDKEILRIFPLRSSLFVFKQDGMYRISGEVAPFTVQLFDSSCILNAPDTVDVTENIIFAWSTTGISQITESGTSEISQPIDIQTFKLSSSTYPNFKTLTWGVGYNSDNSYTVFTNSQPSDTVATIGFRYSTLTKTWTNVVRSQTCGMIRSTDDLLYMGNGTENNINQERKSYTRTDYADKDFTLQLTAGMLSQNGKILQFTNVSALGLGDAFVQTQYVTIYTFNALLQKLDIDPGLKDKNYYSTLAISAGANLRSSLVALAQKLDADSGTSTKTYYQHIADQTTNTVLSSSTANPTVLTTSSIHNLVDGRIITISGTQSPPSIPVISAGNYTVSNTGTWGSSTTFTIPLDVTTGGTTGLSISTAPNSNGFLDIQACYNAIIGLLNLDTGVTFNDYVTVTTSTDFESVIISINEISKKVTMNITSPFLIGPIQAYKAIPNEILYSPLTFGDPLSLKQIFQATAMFNNTAFTSATMSFSSDLKPDFIGVPFNNLGNGIFGSYSDPGFGFGYFGGSGNSKPFRTLIPLQTQRCRYINVKYDHQVAREICELYGITLTGVMSESFRAYR